MSMASLRTPLLCLLVLVVTEGWAQQTLLPGCYMRPLNVTVRSDRLGSCRGSRVVLGCAGYCESSSYPSEYSVMEATDYRHNITSVSQCCTIGSMRKVKVWIKCPGGWYRGMDIYTAKTCKCEACLFWRY
ncbi:PREDICTED: glycoprotein hormone alpha-2 [Elephantulus edwardii]|uniref:glycoprotein hormone alpha-2 n=1 Tax=Elephantulus edwardii TaxID=28737 RepID=UPI0003F06EB0|nr:PREDICTED: glycoprotein hormone alpha-2 [Elephantulus edwardii]